MLLSQSCKRKCSVPYMISFHSLQTRHFRSGAAPADSEVDNNRPVIRGTEGRREGLLRSLCLRQIGIGKRERERENFAVSASLSLPRRGSLSQSIEKKKKGKSLAHFATQRRYKMEFGKAASTLRHLQMQGYSSQNDGRSVRRQSKAEYT